MVSGAEPGALGVQSSCPLVVLRSSGFARAFVGLGGLECKRLRGSVAAMVSTWQADRQSPQGRKGTPSFPLFSAARLSPLLHPRIKSLPDTLWKADGDTEFQGVYRLFGVGGSHSWQRPMYTVSCLGFGVLQW